MFKNIDFYNQCVRICFFQSNNVTYSNSACMTKSSFITEKKLCKLHIRVFEIVAHRIVDNCMETIIDMMYLDAGARQRTHP